MDEKNDFLQKQTMLFGYALISILVIFCIAGFVVVYFGL